MGKKGFKTINIPKKLHKELDKAKGQASFSRYIKKVLDENERLRKENKTLRENNGHHKERKLERQGYKINTPRPTPRLDPMERAKHYPPCPHEIRMYDKYFDLFFCANKIKPPYTERKITNAETTPERCNQCVEIHQRQQRLNALIREKKSDSFAGQRRIDWGKAEGLPFDFRY